MQLNFGCDKAREKKIITILECFKVGRQKLLFRNFWSIIGFCLDVSLAFYTPIAPISHQIPSVSSD